MMAKIYIFEGIDEKKQLDTAAKYSKAGLDVEVHYHKVWETQDNGMAAIGCNDKCIQRFWEENG